MSSFKKLRLDPETSRALNQPGANHNDSRGDGLGGSYMDSSSFSSSTSGGTGGSSRNCGPFRTRYSTPVGLAGPTSFSRFAPYYFGKERRNTLKVPLIRARRDDSDSDRPSSRASLNSSIGGDSTTSVASSTAQRIIETLQNLSTPVMNAGKIRIDQDIKAVQPLPFGSGSPLSRLSPGSSRSRTGGPPKMCSSLLLSNPSSSNQVTPLSSDQRRLFCIPRMKDAATNTEKDVESPAISSSASPTQSRLDYNKNPVLQSFSKPPAAPSSTASKSITTSTSKSRKDESDDEEFHECNSDFNFSSSGWAPDMFSQFFDKNKSVAKGNSLKSQQPPPLLNGFKENSTHASASKLSPRISKSNITVTDGMKPAGSGGFSFASSSPTNSVKPSISATPAQAKRWRCPTCMVENDPTAAACVCCTEKNPNPVSGGAVEKKDSVSPAPQPTFKFGLSSASSAASTEQKSGFAFGAASPSTTTASPASSFNFGVDSSAKPGVSSVSFGGSSKQQTASPTQATTASGPVSGGSNTSFSLGSKNTAPATTSTTLATTTSGSSTFGSNISFSFGSTSSAPVASSATPATTTSASSKFSFSSSSSSSSLKPSVSAPLSASAKRWRCPTCMVENDPTAAECVCCTEKNPNPVSGGAVEKKNSSVAPAPQPTFKFGLSSASGGGASTEQKSGFNFGTSGSTSSAPPAPTFNFGAGGDSAAKPALSSFSFGSTSQQQAAISTPATTTTASGPVSIGSTSNASFGFGSTSNVPATNSAPPAKTTPGPPAFGSNTSFSFGSTSSGPAAAPSATPSTTTSGPSTFASNTPFNFGSNSGAAVTSNTTPVTTAAGPATTFGSNSTFSFGSSSSASAPAPGLFGQMATASSQPTPAPAPTVPSFTFGASATPAPTFNPSLPAAPLPSFNQTPNLNFGAATTPVIPFGAPTQPTLNAGSQAPPALFQFAATPQGAGAGRPSPSANSNRPIKKAVRRYKR